MDFGYLRVSTGGQSTERQLDGLALDRTFADTAGGHVRDRPQLAALLDQVRPGDTIHVHSLDRLARSLAHLLELVETITGRGVALVFYREGLAFDGGTGTALQRMQLQMLGAVAEFERALIAERAAEGRAVAKARGVRFGRPAALTAAQVREARAMRAAGKTVAAIALDLDVSRQVIYRALRAGEEAPSVAPRAPAAGRSATAPRVEEDGTSRPSRDVGASDRRRTASHSR